MLSRPGSRRHFDVVDPSEGSVLATGDGLNAKDAQRLSTALDRALWQGRVEEHLRQDRPLALRSGGPSSCRHAVVWPLW